MATRKYIGIGASQALNSRIDHLANLLKNLPNTLPLNKICGLLAKWRICGHMMIRTDVYGLRFWLRDQGQMSWSLRACT